MAVTIEIEISEDGKIKVEPTGYTDNKCMTDLDDLKSYLEKVGIKTETTDQKLKAGSYVKNTERTRNYAKR